LGVRNDGRASHAADTRGDQDPESRFRAAPAPGGAHDKTSRLLREFDEVSMLMGSFSHDLASGAMVTFQWPTGLNFWNYLTDCPRAEREHHRLQLRITAGRRGAGPAAAASPRGG